MRRTTQKDVARLAKVSQTSVSLAFRNDPSLPKSTRTRILKAAAKVGYRPDPMLSSLIAYRQANRPVHYRETIGWIQMGPDPLRDTDHHFYRVGATAQAEALGYNLDRFLLGAAGMTEENLSDVLAARGVRGLLIAPMPETHGHLNLKWDRFSAVTFGYTLESPILNLVANHHYRSMLLLLRELRARGYQRIGLAIPARHDERIDYSYSAAFLVEQRHSGIPKSHGIPPCYLTESRQASFAAWLARHTPDALITVGYLPVDQWLTDLRIRVPEDLGVAHISPRAGKRKFSGVVENAHLLGSLAVDLLSAMLTRNERGVPVFPQRVLIESQWIEGDSLREQTASTQKSKSRKRKNSPAGQT